MNQNQHHATSDSWRVVVFTNAPHGIVYTIADEVLRSMGHRIVGVVTSPGPKRRRSEGYLDVVEAVRPGIDVIVSNHPDRWADMIAPMKPDLILSGGFPWRIPEDVLAIPRLGAVNVHPSMLPRYRGPGPFEAIFRCGDSETGMTAHRISPEFDGGPILVQTPVPITDDDDAFSILGKMMQMLPEVFRQALERVARGEMGEPQDESLATYAGLQDESLRTIDWNRSARAIHNQVRSWTGLLATPKGAFAMFGDDEVVVEKTRLNSAAPTARGRPAPGTFLEQIDDEITIQCGDVPLTIVTWHSHNPESVADS
jgi:methionyl-tRNA formyltransferase